MSSSRQILPRRLLAAGIALGLTAWAVFSLLPRVSPSDSRASERLESPSTAPGSQSTRITAPAPLRGPLPRAHSRGLSPLAASRRAYAAMLRHFDAPDGLFTKYADEPKYAGAWSLAQAIDGAIGLAKLPGGGVSTARIESMFSLLRFYWSPSSRTPGYDKAVLPPL